MPKFAIVIASVVSMVCRADAQEFESLAAIEGVAADAVAQSGMTVAPIDGRIRLAKCNSHLAASAEIRGTVGVSCAAPEWMLRLRVRNPNDGRPVLVRRGDPVQMLAYSDEFQITSEGVADTAGRSGDMVRINSKRGLVVANVVVGRVIGPGVVEIVVK